MINKVELPEWIKVVESELVEEGIMLEVKEKRL
jgi:hypothetical protein